MHGDAVFDKRGSVHSSLWHWGEGTQFLKIEDVAALRAELGAHSGIPGLEVVQAATEGYAERAAALFHRDGFVCVSGVLGEEHVAALRARTDDCMRNALASDRFGGSKGAWRFMFSSGELSGTCMHYPEYVPPAGRNR